MGSKASKNQSKGTKPLTYPSLVSVVEFISFGRRKQLYAKCPTIRKFEERLPYHLERVEIKTIGPSYIILKFDNFAIGSYHDNKNKISLGCSENWVERSTGTSLYEATEKFALYNLSRPGTTIKTLETKYTPTCILNCIPMAIEKLIVYANEEHTWIRTSRPVENLETDFIIRHDTIKYAKHVTVTRPPHLPIRIHADILSEWNCESITIERKLTDVEVVDYCRRVSKRTDRPIGSVFKSGLSGYSRELFQMLSRESNTRKIVFFGGLIQCVTIRINKSTELNVYEMEPGICVKVSAR
ncbi:hypothetical protein GCK72_021201 [Caenorhabditis remanei]|uniref:DUF38 domain-containing protein n=1 Tax=Caenorhabditis remanei TaxID=31234 RepID=E3NBF4_CAERE|nr:hypothetical protein GCK72_021201 [Caenorhabditis remanei]EFO91982.1 hypothetical protein CRE_11465 [Caenorhabditis remanei]KAF1754638.1 hypothetical protein GCK72_021201 [Caenorhabditis remanei]